MKNLSVEEIDWTMQLAFVWGEIFSGARSPGKPHSNPELIAMEGQEDVVRQIEDNFNSFKIELKKCLWSRL